MLRTPPSPSMRALFPRGPELPPATACAPSQPTDDAAVLVDADVLVEANGHAEESKAPKAEDSIKLYFVRMPRPPMDDTLLKRLQTEFQSHITDIKAINTRLAAKRVGGGGPCAW